MWARHEAQEFVVIEAEEAGRVDGTEPAEEVRIGGDPVPSLADGGAARTRQLVKPRRNRISRRMSSLPSTMPIKAADAATPSGESFLSLLFGSIATAAAQIGG